MNKFSENPANPAGSNSPLEFWKRSEAARARLLSAKETFRNKTYYEQFAPIEQVARSASLLLPAISVATGALMFWGGFSASLSLHDFAVAGFLVGIAVFSAIEAAKSKLLQSGFVMVFKSRWSFAAPLLLVAGFLVAFSALASLDGAQVAHKQSDNSISTTSAQMAAARDSLLKPLVAAVEAEETALSDYKNSVSWRGKIDLSNRATSATITAREKSISDAKTELLSKKRELDKEGRAAIVSAKAEFSSRHGWVVWAIALVESLILLANLFIVYYDYRTQADAGLIERNLSGEVLTMTSADFQSFFQGMLLPSAPLIAQKGADQARPNKIGFKTESAPRGGKRVSELESYLAKHSDVVEAINEGLPESQVLAKTGIGRTTYYNVKRVINNLQSGEVST